MALLFLLLLNEEARTTLPEPMLVGFPFLLLQTTMTRTAIMIPTLKSLTHPYPSCYSPFPPYHCYHKAPLPCIARLRRVKRDQTVYRVVGDAPNGKLEPSNSYFEEYFIRKILQFQCDSECNAFRNAMSSCYSENLNGRKIYKKVFRESQKI